MKKIDLANIQESTGSERLPAGGYVCKYTKVEDVPEKQYLYIEFDIARGDYAGYYASLSESAGFWGGRCYRSYKETALPMFKRMCSAVSKSNNGYVFDAGEKNADEKTLVGKLVGIVMCEEEYVGNDGSTKTRLYVDRECSVEDIIAGKFKVKPLRKLDSGKQQTKKDDSFVNVPEGMPTDMPF